MIFNQVVTSMKPGIIHVPQQYHVYNIVQPVEHIASWDTWIDTVL